MTDKKADMTSFWGNSTCLYVAFTGILAWFTASTRGISETLQGNTQIGGFVLTTIGAVTIIPNYLLTGIATIIVALSFVIWAVGFADRKHGSTVLSSYRFIPIFIALYQRLYFTINRYLDRALQRNELGLCCRFLRTKGTGLDWLLPRAAAGRIGVR
jgi:hypothetical protein